MLLSRLNLLWWAKTGANRTAQCLYSAGKQAEGCVEEESIAPASKQGSMEVDYPVQPVEIAKKSKKKFNNHLNYSLNQVELIGGVGAEPTFLIAENGKEFCYFPLITNVVFHGRDGETAENKETHTIKVFGKLVQYVRENVNRGNRLFVFGRINYNDERGPDSRFMQIIPYTLFVTKNKKK